MSTADICFKISLNASVAAQDQATFALIAIEILDLSLIVDGFWHKPSALVDQAPLHVHPKDIGPAASSSNLAWIFPWSMSD